MKIIVTPGSDGLVSNAGQILGQVLPENAALVDLPETGAELPPMSAALLRDGALVIVPNWIGSGPWYDQAAVTADRLTPIEVTDYGVDPTTKNWAMTPRPETSTEKKAREKAEADALAAAERARIMALSASAVQFAQASASAGIITEAEAVAWASAGTLPAVLAAAIDAIPDPAAQFQARIKAAGATTYERGSAVVMALGAAIGKTETELDALFTLAVSL
jgi:hypothetical protein